MKKILSAVVVLFAAVLLLSAFNPMKRGLKTGNIAPEVVLGDSTLYTADETNDAYTLVNFWASYDATSRIANINYNNAIDTLDTARIRYIAVSYDRLAVLFDRTARRDNLCMHHQYYDNAGSESQLYKRYRLKNGFASYLIAPDGKIVAQNPDPRTLASILGEY